MTKLFSHIFTLMLTLLGVASTASAREPWSFDTEVLYMQANTTAGFRQDDVFGYDPSQRYTLAYTGPNNLGIRGKYYSYDQTGVDPGRSRLMLDFENIDIELFKRLDISTATSVEFSGGLRYNEAEIFFPSPAEPNDFDGFGGIVGLKGKTQVFTGGSVYARGALALLSGDGNHDGNTPNIVFPHQMGRTQTELALGYEHPFELSRAIITPHCGMEWLNMGSYQIDPVDEHPDSDLLLAGFSLGLRIDF